MKPKLTAREIFTLRREAHGIGNLVKLGLITVTDSGHAWVAQDDKRVSEERSRAGSWKRDKKGGKK